MMVYELDDTERAVLEGRTPADLLSEIPRSCRLLYRLQAPKGGLLERWIGAEERAQEMSEAAISYESLYSQVVEQRDALADALRRMIGNARRYRLTETYYDRLVAQREIDDATAQGVEALRKAGR